MTSKLFSPWADLAAAAVCLMAATLVAAMCVLPLSGAFRGLERGVSMIAVYTVQFTLAITALSIWYRRGGGTGLRFGANWAVAPMILLGIVTVTAAGVVIEPLLNLFPERYFEQLNEMIGRGGAAIVLTVVAAPVLEEVFFRGLVLERLSRKWNAATAIAAAAALFGLVHAPNLPQMVNAFVAAIIMGYIYLATRSLIPVIVIHAVNNGAAYLLTELTGTQGTDTREMLNNDPLYWIIYAASIAILTLFLAFTASKVRTKKIENTLNTKTPNEHTQ